MLITFYLSYSVNVIIHQIDVLGSSFLKVSSTFVNVVGHLKYSAHAQNLTAEASPRILFTILSPR